jgi:hypothetical protein
MTSSAVWQNIVKYFDDKKIFPVQGTTTTSKNISRYTGMQPNQVAAGLGRARNHEEILCIGYVGPNDKVKLYTRNYPYSEHGNFIVLITEGIFSKGPRVAYTELQRLVNGDLKTELEDWKKKRQTISATKDDYLRMIYLVCLNNLSDRLETSFKQQIKNLDISIIPEKWTII